MVLSMSWHCSLVSKASSYVNSSRDFRSFSFCITARNRSRLPSSACAAIFSNTGFSYLFLRQYSRSCSVGLLPVHRASLRRSTDCSAASYRDRLSFAGCTLAAFVASLSSFSFFLLFLSPFLPHSLLPPAALAGDTGPSAGPTAAAAGGGWAGVCGAGAFCFTGRSSLCSSTHCARCCTSSRLALNSGHTCNCVLPVHCDRRRFA
mmetsp:Transcript_68410/g.114963  ORF Transcript_68410/g.114963 Transcript_68410/m.114963 type:complete len:205 (+) Transcript_68410:359-973(+)